MKQDTHTFLLPLRAVDDEYLEALRRIGDEVQRGLERLGEPRRHAVFEDVGTLHYLSCSILDGQQGGPALLALELSFDGSVGDCLRDLLQKHPAVMQQILERWEEYPRANASPEAVIAKLAERGRRADAVYIGTPGRSVAQIREEESLRSDLIDALERDDSARTREERWECAVARLRASRPGFAPAPPRPLRVRFNVLASPIARARLGETLRLAVWALLLLAGAVGAVRVLVGPRELWHEVAVVVLPLAAAGASLVLGLSHAPGGLTRRARLGVVAEAARGASFTAAGWAVAGGLAVLVFESDWEKPFGVTALLWCASVALGALQLVVVAAYLYAARSARAAGAGALLTAVAGVVLFGSRLGIEQVFGILALVYLATGAFVALQVSRFARALRRRESARAYWDEDEDLAHLARVKRREYQQGQSHLVSETQIVEGGMGTLRGVLRVVRFFATWYFNLGHLATIPSIHFARFLVLPERNSLLFFSNYDDRFDSYLGDFSDVAGVTAVWGNTHKFPKPFLLVLDGARQENLFKRFARDSQRESLIWYSAYPDLTVSQIDRASRLREAMTRPVDDGRTGLRAALSRWWRRPLDEVALDVLMEGR